MCLGLERTKLPVCDSTDNVNYTIIPGLNLQPMHTQWATRLQQHIVQRRSAGDFDLALELNALEYIQSVVGSVIDPTQLQWSPRQRCLASVHSAS